MRIFLAVWLAVATLGSAAAAQCAAPGNYAQLATAIGQGLNANRAAGGLNGLGPDQALTNAAQRQACDVAASGRISHSGSDGSSVGDRVRQAGYGTCLTAENLAWGYPDPSSIVQGWMQSASHRSNMLLPAAAEYGVGIADGGSGPIWVLVIARPC